MPSLAPWIGVPCVALSSVIPAQSQLEIRQIKIRSHWGGLGPRADADIAITRTGGSYRQNGQEIAPALVDAVVAALRSSLIPKPEAATLGITTSWLAAHAATQEPHPNNDPGQPTSGQRALFRRSFTDMKLIERVIPFDRWKWLQLAQKRPSMDREPRLSASLRLILPALHAGMQPETAPVKRVIRSANPRTGRFIPTCASNV